jgi:hypothetical protein
MAANGTAEAQPAPRHVGPVDRLADYLRAVGELDDALALIFHRGG